MFSTGGIFDSDLEFIQPRWVACQNACQVELLHLLLKPAGQARVHAGTTGEYDVFVQFSANIDGRILDSLEEHFCNPRLLDVN